MSCSKTLEPGADLGAAVAAASAGATLCLKPGSYVAALRVDKPLTLRGLGPGVVVDGDGRGSVVRVAAEGAHLTLEDLTLSGGEADLGGAIEVLAEARVTVTGCVLQGNVARDLGGAIHLDRGELVVQRTVLRDNRAKQGGAILLDGHARARISDSLFASNQASRGAAVTVRHEAKLALSRSTLAANQGDAADLRARGSIGSQPEVVLDGCVLFGGLDARPPHAVVVTRTVFAPGARGFVIGPDNVQHDPLLDAAHRPTAGSPAAGRAPGGGSDLAGAQRPAEAATAGAYELAR